MTIDWTFRMGEIAIDFATLMGPILAVQAQKWIERSREQNNGKSGFLSESTESYDRAFLIHTNGVPCFNNYKTYF
jgi:hypothetical protein